METVIAVSVIRQALAWAVYHYSSPWEWRSPKMACCVPERTRYPFSFPRQVYPDSFAPSA